MKKEKIKFILKKYFSERMFKCVVALWRNYYLPIRNFYDKYKIKYFIKPFFKKFNFSGVNFFILIDNNNGEVDNEIYLHGAFEKPCLELIKNNLNKGGVFIDIGANIGQHSLFASKIVGNDGRVVLFEPLKDLCEQIEKSVQKNEIKNIFINNVGCGDKEIVLPIYSSRKNMGASSVFPSDDKKKNGNIEIVVPDRILEKERRVDFIKIDTEGYEMEVLRGLKETIIKHHPKILLELSPCYYRLKDDGISGDIIKFLFENKYLIEDLIYDRKISPTSCNDYLSKIDQTNLFCV